jgi:hypothetical protein
MVVEYLGTLEGILYDNTRLLFLEAIGGNDSYHGWLYHNTSIKVGIVLETYYFETERLYFETKHLYFETDSSPFSLVLTGSKPRHALTSTCKSAPSR